MSQEDNIGGTGPDEVKVEAEEGANVALVPRADRPITEPIEGVHEGEVNIGLDITIKLPSAAQQKAGFKLREADAAALIAQYPWLYKRLVPKAVPNSTTQQQGQQGNTWEKGSDANAT